MKNQNASANTNSVADENGDINCTNCENCKNCADCTECEICKDCGTDRTSDDDENEVGAE